MLELTAIKIADYLGNDLTAISKGTTKTVQAIEIAVEKINEKKICKYLSLTPVTTMLRFAIGKFIEEKCEASLFSLFFSQYFRLVIPPSDDPS